MSVSQERRTHKGARQEKERKEGQKKGEFVHASGCLSRWSGYVGVHLQGKGDNFLGGAFSEWFAVTNLHWFCVKGR